MKKRPGTRAQPLPARPGRRPAAAPSPLVARVIRELRPPLRSVLRALAILKARPLNARQQRALAIAERQAGHADRLLDDLVGQGRTVVPAFSLHPVVVDMRRVVREAVHQVTPAARAAGLAIEAALPSASLTVHGDPDRLQQVIVNVLVNAIKFTPRGGRIAIAAGRERASVLVRIRDSGPGIGRKDLQRIFEPRVGGHGQGLGLGLTIAREIIEAHGGRIEARSGGPGRGAEFRIACPVLHKARRAVRAELEAEAGLTNKKSR